MKYHGICLGLAILACACLSAGCQNSAADSRDLSVTDEGSRAALIKGSAGPRLLSELEPGITVFQQHDGTKRVFSRFSPAATVWICSDSDFQKLSRLAYVKDLTLFGCGSCFTIRDLEPLKALDRLESLYVSNEELTDLSALSGLVNMRSLTLSGNQIQDLAPLAGLSGLEELRLSSNRIEDLSPLAELPRLRLLVLDCNPIQDITPLSGMDSQARVTLKGTNLAWNGWEPVKGIQEVDGRPAAGDAGISPCPQDWVDRIQAAYPDGLILSLDYDDYDGDGVYEAFAFVADRKSPSDYLFEGYGGVFLLVTQDSMEELDAMDSGLIPGAYFRFGDRKIVRLDYINSLTSSVSFLWTVDGGKPRGLNLSGWGQYFHKDSEGNLCLLHSVYDGTSDHTGHSYKPYYFYFDGQDFVEYGAVPITVDQFLTCPGAEGILAEIEQDGMTVADILYRKNGLIHLNLKLDYEHGMYDSNYYRTYRLEDDGRLMLKDQDMGYYLDTMTDIPVDYPTGFPVFSNYDG